MNVSPAPTVSTTLTLGAEIRTRWASVTAVALVSPLVITTIAGPAAASLSNACSHGSLAMTLPPNT